MSIFTWFKGFFSNFNKDEPTEPQPEKQSETRIEYLVRELIKELEIEGKDIQYPQNISDSMFGFSVEVWDLGQPDELIRIQNIINNWKMDFKR